MDDMVPGSVRPLRVALDARLPDGLAGGVQQFVIGLAAALSRLDDGDDEFVFLARRGEGAWLEPYISGPCRIMWLDVPRSRRGPPSLGQRVRRHLSTRAPSLRDAWRQARRMIGLASASVPRSDGTAERASFDVLHFTFQDAFLTALPTIYQPWDLQHVHLPQFFSETERHRRETTYRTFCERARLTVVASGWTKRDVAAHFGLEPSRIAVVGVPPATDAYRSPSLQDRESVRTGLDLPSAFIFYPAQTWPHKNHQRLLEALALLRDERGLVVPLVCSGSKNDWFAQVERAVGTLSLTDQVRFVGFVPPDRLTALYSLARALVFPSLFEGWGFPVLEAFSAGLPVACSNVTSLPEIAGDAALVFDPVDVQAIARSIESLWTDDALRHTLVTRGRQVAAAFDWLEVARTYRALYRSVAGQRLSADDRARLAAADLGAA